MPSPLPSLSFPASTSNATSSHKRKRSRSSTLIVQLSPPYDIKRARTGIQELSTDDSRPSLPAVAVADHLFSPQSSTDSSSLPSLVNSLTSATTADSPETQETLSDTSSSSEDSFGGGNSTTSSSGSSSGNEADQDEYPGVDEGYDSVSEVGDVSTTTSSSSSSSSEASASEDEEGGETGDYDDEEDGELQSRSRSMTLASPLHAQEELPSLASRLDAFIPTLAAANARLERERERGALGERDIENVGEDGRYIEMDLGLGVLEEKKDEDSVGESEDGGSWDEDAGNDAEDESEVTDASGVPLKERKRVRRKRGHVMDRLMGRRVEDGTAGIEVVESEHTLE